MGTRRPSWGLIGGVVSLYNNDSDKVQKVVDAIKRASYAYDLAPTQALIENSVRPDLVARSGMQLRLALVALEDGDLYYVSEAGHLLRGRAAHAGFDEPITNPQVTPWLELDRTPYKAKRTES